MNEVKKGVAYETLSELGLKRLDIEGIIFNESCSISPSILISDSEGLLVRVEYENLKKLSKFIIDVLNYERLGVMVFWFFEVKLVKENVNVRERRSLSILL